jgi:flagellar export protein FliJ
MKSLTTLIKLYRKQLDDKRIELVREQETLDELNKILIYIREEIRQEKNVAEKSSVGRYSFPGYIGQAVGSERRIANLIAEQENKIEAIRDAIAEQFSELKKYEILLEVKQSNAAKEEARLEQIELDEIATNSFLQERRDE